MNKKTTAVIIARKGSVRIPGKMHQPINGESMILRKLRQCLAIPGIYQVIVGSDDESIANQVRNMGAGFILRQPEYCDEKSRTVNEVIINMLQGIHDADRILWAHPTNPFIDSEHYADAIATLDEVEKDGYDSLISMNTMHGHFWHQNLSPINFGALEPRHKIASHLPPVYAQNGGIFIRPYADMLKDGALMGGRAFIYPMESIIGWDIDHPWQLEFAQWYAKQRNL